MATLMESVWRQALYVFSREQGLARQSFEENFQTLTSLADKVTANDVKLDTRLLDRTFNAIGRRKPPVTYIEIYEDDSVTIGIFILRSGVKLPLHDHPGMHGILKVIFGTVSIQSYNVVPLNNTAYNDIEESEHMLAEKLPITTISQSDKACTLTPSERNLHEICSIDGPAAFLDILAPPYETEPLNVTNLKDRSCHYFEEVPLITQIYGENVKKLRVTPSPPEFWSDSAPYKGPELRLP